MSSPPWRLYIGTFWWYILMLFLRRSVYVYLRSCEHSRRSDSCQIVSWVSHLHREVLFDQISFSLWCNSRDFNTEPAHDMMLSSWSNPYSYSDMHWWAWIGKDFWKGSKSMNQTTSTAQTIHACKYSWKGKRTRTKTGGNWSDLSVLARCFAFFICCLSH